jgi:hypothetical protein
MGSLRSLRSVAKQVEPINRRLAFKIFSAHLNAKGFIEYKFSRGDVSDPLGEAFLDWSRDKNVQIVKETCDFITARVF